MVRGGRKALAQQTKATGSRARMVSRPGFQQSNVNVVGVVALASVAFANLTRASVTRHTRMLEGDRDTRCKAAVRVYWCVRGNSSIKQHKCLHLLACIPLC